MTYIISISALRLAIFVHLFSARRHGRFGTRHQHQPMVSAGLSRYTSNTISLSIRIAGPTQSIMIPQDFDRISLDAFVLFQV